MSEDLNPRWEILITRTPMPDNNPMDWMLVDLVKPSNLFAELSAFEEATERAKRLGYTVLEYDCRQFQNQEDIFNAMLRSVGEIKEGHVYRNISPFWFWDLFIKPPSGAENAALMAFKYFDDFYRANPECGQMLMGMLADHHYYALKTGERLLLCYHWPNKTLQPKPVLTMEASWNDRPRFSEAVDRRREKNERVHAWFKLVMERYDADDSVVERLPSNRAFSALVDQLKPKFVEDIEDMAPSVEEAVELIKRHQAVEAERLLNDPVHLDRLWKMEVMQLVQDRIGIRLNLFARHRIRDWFKQMGREFPTRSTSTQEAAVETILSIPAEEWDKIREACRSRIERIDGSEK